VHFAREGGVQAVVGKVQERRERARRMAE